MRKWLRRHMPSPEQISRNRWLIWLGPSLLHPRLWHFSRRGVAVGVSLGVFFGLLVPVAQMPFAAGAAILLRANVPVAIGSTLVTNPVTFAPIYLVAHRLGATLLGEKTTKVPDLLQAPKTASDKEASWWKRVWSRLLVLGKPLLLGLGILAITAGMLTYVLIMLVWRLRVAWNWRQRKRKNSDAA